MPDLVIKPIKSVIDKKRKDLEKLKDKSTGRHGGKRPGAGRPEGSENQSTKEEREAEEQFRARVKRSIGKLMNSQFNLAGGCQFLFKIETKRWKDRRNVWHEERKKPQIVENQIEIEKYLAGDLDNEKNVYYFLTTNKPDNKAIDSLLDRTFGKASQKIDLKGTITFEDLVEENENRKNN